MEATIGPYHQYSAEITNFHYVHTYSLEPTNVPPHRHDTYEIYYLLKGSVQYTVGSHQYQLSDGDLLLINDRELHEASFGESDGYDRVVIHFKAEYLNGLYTSTFDLLEAFTRRKVGQANLIPGKLCSEYGVYELIQQIEDCIAVETPEMHVTIKLNFARLLIVFSKIFHAHMNDGRQGEGHDRRVAAVIDYINHNFASEISLDLLEDRFAVSRYHLCHLFKVGTGYTVFEFLANRRVKKAKDFIRQGVPLLDICHMVGFSDYSSFYRTFRKVTGMSPRAFQHT